MKFDDDTVLWFGKHRGRRLEDVPAEYLFWVRDAFDPDSEKNRALLAYIAANESRLNAEFVESTHFDEFGDYDDFRGDT